ATTSTLRRSRARARTPCPTGRLSKTEPRPGYPQMTRCDLWVSALLRPEEARHVHEGRGEQLVLLLLVLRLPDQALHGDGLDLESVEADHVAELALDDGFRRGHA